MREKPAFGRWITTIEQLRRNTGLSLSQNHFVAETEFTNELLSNPPLLKALGNDQAGAARYTAEHNWHIDGRPYFKMWPGICEALKRTRIDIPTSAFASPYLSWELKLPRSLGKSLKIDQGALLVSISNRDNLIKHSPRSITDDGAWRQMYENARTKQLTRLQQIESERNKAVAFQIAYFYGHEDDHGKCITQANFLLFVDETIEQGFSVEEERLPTVLTEEEGNWIHKIIVGVALFGINRHELVLPDVTQPIYTIKARGKKKQAALKALQRDAYKGNVKWKVGSEIDLPRPLVHYEESKRRGTGEELQFGHVRSGHMRMQPCGPRNQQRKLIFIAPTIVRPDLEVRQTHGYRLQDRILNTMPPDR